MVCRPKANWSWIKASESSSSYRRWAKREKGSGEEKRCLKEDDTKNNRETDGMIHDSDWGLGHSDWGFFSLFLSSSSGVIPSLYPMLYVPPVLVVFSSHPKCTLFTQHWWSSSLFYSSVSSSPILFLTLRPILSSFFSLSTLLLFVSRSSGLNLKQNESWVVLKIIIVRQEFLSFWWS